VATTLAALLALAIGQATAAPWTYRGTLSDGGKPAQGQYDLRLTLLDNGHALTQPLTLFAVAVNDGNFAVEVDFGVDMSQAPPLQLRTEVQRANEPGSFVALGEPTRFDAKAALGGICWDTVGNAGTNPALNFLGTTDSQPLVLRTRNVQSLRIEPSGVLFGGTPITANVIAGSNANMVAAGVRGATISGGGVPSGDSDPDHFREAANRVTDDYGSIGGGYNNQAGDAGAGTSGSFAVVGGGRANTASGSESTVGGGLDNVATATHSTVSGGDRNQASGILSTVGGGQQNLATELQSTVSGGQQNEATGLQSSVGGGQQNLASGPQSAVSGGQNNTSSGSHSVVSGGRRNCAGGSRSWAGGTQAKARPPTIDTDGFGCTDVPATGTSGGDAGAFVWADSESVDFVSTGVNQFLVRASGGAVFQPLLSGTSARSPRGYFNVVYGDSGIPQPSELLTSTVATFENDNNAFVRLLAPDNLETGLLFGNVGNLSDGGVVYSNLSDALDLRTSGNVTRMRIAASGLVTVFNLNGAGSTSLCRNASNQLSNCSSSARYKEQIKDLPPSLDAVLRLRPVGYVWKADGMADVGFIAEEVAALDERLVTRNEAGEIEGVKYDRLSAVLAAAMQEMDARQELLEANQALLDKRLAALESERAR
jgi:hypothetical protein